MPLPVPFAAATRWRSRMQGPPRTRVAGPQMPQPVQMENAPHVEEPACHPIEDIVDGTTTEDCADRRQNHRLCIGATEHLDGKGRARRERDRELGAVVGRGAGVEQKPCVGSLTRLDTLDNLGPFALQLSGIPDRGRLGSTGGGNRAALLDWGLDAGAVTGAGAATG